MQSLMAAAVALAAALSGITLSEGVDCHAGSAQPVAAAGTNLELSAVDWGGYCEGLSTWSMEDAANGLILDYGGGGGYTNVHFYRNLSAPSGARNIDFSLDVLVPATSFNNEGSASTIQALEFTASRWENGVRHEFALQWTNVGLSRPGYRIWHPSHGWVDTGIRGVLKPGWHAIRIVGQVTSQGAKLRSIAIDGVSYRLNTTVPSVAAPGVGDIAAVAVQLDGNWEGTPYSVTVRNVDLIIR